MKQQNSILFGTRSSTQDFGFLDAQDHQESALFFCVHVQPFIDVVVHRVLALPTESCAKANANTKLVRHMGIREVLEFGSYTTTFDG